MWRKKIKKYFYTWKRLLSNGVGFAVLPKAERGDALPAWEFLTITYAICLFVDRMLFSWWFHRLSLVPSRTDLTWIQVIIFCLLLTLLLGFLFRKREPLGIRQSFYRLRDAVFYLMAGPVVFYITITAIFLGAVALVFLKRVGQASVTEVYVYVAAIFGLLFVMIVIPIVYVVCAIRRLYKISWLLAAFLVSLVWFCSFVFAVPLNTISESSLSADEHTIVNDLRVISFAEAAYMASSGSRCGNVADLKERAKQLEGDWAYGEGIPVALIPMASDDFGEHVHGYRIIIGRNPRYCGIEAVPMAYDKNGTHLSFLTNPGVGAIINVDDKQGAFATPWDKVLRPTLGFDVSKLAL